MSELLLPRRKFLLGAAALLAAPAIVRASSLMPIKAQDSVVETYLRPYLPASELIKLSEWLAERKREFDQDYNFFRSQHFAPN